MSTSGKDSVVFSLKAKTIQHPFDRLDRYIRVRDVVAALTQLELDLTLDEARNSTSGAFKASAAVHSIKTVLRGFE